MGTEKITVWHKPTCSKCINAMEFFELHGVIPDEWRDYLIDIPTEEEIREVLQKLGIPAEQLVRKKEPVFVERFEGKQLSEDEYVAIMHRYPELIQRPILIKGNRAYIGRSDEELNRALL